MSRGLVLAALLVGARAASADDPAGAWEIDGVRLERAQVERLADDLALRTVTAVRAQVADLELRDGQAERLHAIYRGVALDVFGEVVAAVERSDLSASEKEERVRALVLSGQERSHTQVGGVLDPRQLALYAAWEKAQVEAFKSRRWDSRRRGRRR